MNYKNILHGEFKTEVDRGGASGFCSFLDALQYYMQIAYDFIDSIVDYFIVSTSTGTYTDRHAKDVGLERISSETDAKLILRIKDIWEGKVATKANIKNAVDRILSSKGYTETCNVYEFFDPLWVDWLSPGEFTVQLPNVTQWGFVIGYSGFGYIGTARSYREGFFSSIPSMLNSLNLDLIRQTINKKKTCGTNCLLSLSEYILENYGY